MEKYIVVNMLGAARPYIHGDETLADGEIVLPQEMYNAIVYISAGVAAKVAATAFVDMMKNNVTFKVENAQRQE